MAPAVLHATDVVAVNHEDGRVACSNFNLVGDRIFSGDSVRASIRINGRDTDLIMLQNVQDQCFEFPGGSLVPDDGILAGLSLSHGLNTVEFHITPKGSTGEGVTASASLWLWSASDRIAVVDIDGTITKSDVRGLFANFFTGGADNHEGVADAISYVAGKGYRILYLTARPISMATETRKYLESVSKMPDGALITQQHGGIMRALTSKHDEFKISALGQIQALFQAETFASDFVCDPQGSVFAGGFGNAVTDILAYAHAGIARTHIFVADTSSRITNLESGNAFQSYTGLQPHLDDFFPGKDSHPFWAAPVPEMLNVLYAL
eukprot:2196889-Rhodomonas_salina.2